MLASLQTKIHIAEAEIEKRKEDAESPVKSKLSPVAMGRWLAGGPRRVAGKFRRKKKSKDERMMEVQRKLAAQSAGQGKSS